VISAATATAKGQGAVLAEALRRTTSVKIVGYRLIFYSTRIQNDLMTRLTHTSMQHVHQ